MNDVKRTSNTSTDNRKRKCVKASANILIRTLNVVCVELNFKPRDPFNNVTTLVYLKDDSTSIYPNQMTSHRLGTVCLCVVCAPIQNFRVEIIAILKQTNENPPNPIDNQVRVCSPVYAFTHFMHFPQFSLCLLRFMIRI